MLEDAELKSNVQAFYVDFNSLGSVVELFQQEEGRAATLRF